MADLHLVPAPAAAKARESLARSPIRVVLAEDHALLRSSLRALLDAEEGVEVVAEADDLESAARHVAAAPLVLVLDLGMLDGSAREGIGKLRARAPGTQVVLLTMDESPVVAQYVLAGGALGFVLKDRADEELALAVRAAARGEEYVSPRVAARLDAAVSGSLGEG
jgi:two-component system, NarL family, response regulator NreC